MLVVKRCCVLKSGLSLVMRKQARVHWCCRSKPVFTGGFLKSAHLFLCSVGILKSCKNVVALRSHITHNRLACITLPSLPSLVLLWIQSLCGGVVTGEPHAHASRVSRVCSTCAARVQHVCTTCAPRVHLYFMGISEQWSGQDPPHYYDIITYLSLQVQI